MSDNAHLLELMAAIAAHHDIEMALLDDPSLATARLERAAKGAANAEPFLDDCEFQIYAGDTALHVAAASYDVGVARLLLDAGADIGAINRRGARPLHSATRGGPGGRTWDPNAQVEMISFLIAAGAAVDAPAMGGVTPLHRAVRNRCSGAVRALLERGADPTLANENGSTAADLCQWTTGRGGTGSDAARAELGVIVELLGVEP